MSEIELEPDRNRLHDLVRLTWDAAQPGATESSPGSGSVPVTDQDVANAGPYSLQQIRSHLTAEQDDTYLLEREGETLSVVGLRG